MAEHLSPVELFGGGGDGAGNMEEWASRHCVGRCTRGAVVDDIPAFACPLIAAAYAEPYQPAEAWVRDDRAVFGIRCTEREPIPPPPPRPGTRVDGQLAGQEAML